MEENMSKTFKPSKAKDMALQVLQIGKVPFFRGGTGVGKSAVVRDIADTLAKGRKIVEDDDAINPNKKEFGFIDFRLSYYESIDLSGLPYIEDGQQKRAFLGNLPTGGEGLLFLDEIAQANLGLQTASGQLLYERRLGAYQLPEGWQIVIAGNRAEDRAGSSKPPSHLIGRVYTIDFKHDANDWLSWATNNDVSPWVVGFITQFPNRLNMFDPKIVAPQSSPRTWTNFSDVIKVSDQSLWEDFAYTTIGEENALEFTNFVRLSEDLPNLKDILDGKDVEIQEGNGGLMYALCVALMQCIVSASDEEVYTYFDNALAYVQKSATPEFSIFFVKQAVARRDALIETDTYGQFKVDNSKVEFDL
jgi:hypothetical protein